MTEYERWHAMKLDDPDLTEELNAIEGNPEEINDRFYRELEFGTGGLRGVIGAGTNRINIYTVRKATQGLANYLNKKTSHASVAIAYDSRIKSDVFAKAAAEVLACLLYTSQFLLCYNIYTIYLMQFHFIISTEETGIYVRSITGKAHCS